MGATEGGLTSSVDAISGEDRRRRCPRRDGGWATLVNRLKAVPPHFVAHVKALAPKIIMRRFATSERTVTPASGITSCAIKSSFLEIC